MKKILLLLFLSVLMSTPTFGGDELLERLMSAKTLKCEFGAGAYADWQQSSVKVKKDRFNSTFIFESIDLEAGTARVIAYEDGGSESVSEDKVFVTECGLTFIGFRNFGNLSITTVFAAYAKGTEDIIAVNSRHTAFARQAQPSQYHGTCKILE